MESGRVCKYSGVTKAQGECRRTEGEQEQKHGGLHQQNKEDGLPLEVTRAIGGLQVSSDTFTVELWTEPGCRQRVV